MKIAILEPLGVNNLVEMIKKKLPEVEVVGFADRKEDEESLIERSEGADVVVLSNIKYSGKVMEHNPNLKYVCVAFTGYDHIDMEYCANKGIIVSNCSGYSTVGVAELVFGYLISLYRKMEQGNDVTRKQGTKAGLLGYELEGKTMGIIGLGAIGKKVADIALAFGMNVIAYNRSPRKIMGVKMVSLEEVFKQGDVISIHIPSNKETYHLVDERLISLMKENAIFINTARGPIVDYDALALALNEERIAGAGIDVFEKEPPLETNHPILNAKNTLVTPHVGFFTQEAMVKRAAIVIDNLVGYYNGKPINVVK